MSDLNTQSLYWWSPAQLSEMARWLQTTWQAWLRNWVVVPDRRLAEVQCSLAWQAEPPLAARQWSTLGAAGSARAWLDAPGDPAQVAFSALFGSNSGDRAESVNTPIGAAVVRQAHSELFEAMRNRLGLGLPSSEQPPTAPLFKPWSGAVVVSLGCESAGGQLLLLDAQAVNQLMVGSEQHLARPVPRDAPPPPPVAVMAAMADKTVRVQVALAPCELDLGALCGLRVGDVIPLPHSLDTALTVSVGGDAVCTGFLGRQGASRAVELGRQAPSSSTPTHLPN